MYTFIHSEWEEMWRVFCASGNSYGFYPFSSCLYIISCPSLCSIISEKSPKNCQDDLGLDFVSIVNVFRNSQGSLSRPLFLMSMRTTTATWNFPQTNLNLNWNWLNSAGPAQSLDYSSFPRPIWIWIRLEWGHSRSSPLASPSGRFDCSWVDSSIELS